MSKGNHKKKRLLKKEQLISLLADFSVGIMECRKQWKNIISVLKKVPFLGHWKRLEGGALLNKL